MKKLIQDHYPLIPKYLTAECVDALIVQLERVQENRFNTSVFSGEALFQPEYKVEIPRILSRLNALLLLRFKAKDGSSIHESYNAFTKNQTDDVQLKLDSFIQLAKEYQSLNETVFHCMLVAATFVRTDAADKILKQAYPSLVFPSEGHGEVYRDFVFSDEKFYAFTDTSGNKLVPLLHALFKSMDHSAKKAFESMFNIGHLRQMLFCEGGEVLYEKILTRALHENWRPSNLKNWFLLWTNNLMGFRAHIEDSKSGAAFFDRHIFCALDYLAESVYTLINNALTAPKSMRPHLCGMAMRQYLHGISNELNLNSLELAKMLALCMCFNANLINEDVKKELSHYTTKINLNDNPIICSYLAVFFKNLLRVTGRSFSKTLSIGSYAYARSKEIASAQDAKMIGLRLCFQQAASATALNQMVQVEKSIPLICDGMVNFTYLVPVAYDLRAPSVSISIGELVDKLTINAVKLNKIENEEQKKKIQSEYDMQLAKYNELRTEALDKIKSELYQVNEKLYGLEDTIRLLMENNQLNETFIEVACVIRRGNEARAFLKGRINDHLGSFIVEVKSHKGVNEEVKSEQSHSSISLKDELDESKDDSSSRPCAGSNISLQSGFWHAKYNVTHGQQQISSSQSITASLSPH